MDHEAAGLNRQGTEGVDAQRAAASLLGWWSLAGHDAPCREAPRSWLASDAGAAVGADADTAQQPAQPAADTDSPAAAPRTTEAPPTARAPEAPEPRQPVHDLDPAPFPADRAALARWLAEDDAAPGVHFGGNRILPSGQIGAETMIVSDCPSQEDCDAQAPLSGPDGALLKAMLAAMKLGDETPYIATLSLARPVEGEIPRAEIARLGQAMEAHIALAAPKRLLLFGDAASRALLKESLMKARGRLHFINHENGNIPAITTFHPRILRRRPQLKAESWEDLQLLMGAETR